jgi:hypothetical protein
MSPLPVHMHFLLPLIVIDWHLQPTKDCDVKRRFVCLRLLHRHGVTVAYAHQALYVHEIHHYIDGLRPALRCMYCDFKNIFAQKFGENSGVFAQFVASLFKTWIITLVL